MMLLMSPAVKVAGAGLRGFFCAAFCFCFCSSVAFLPLSERSFRGLAGSSLPL